MYNSVLYLLCESHWKILFFLNVTKNRKILSIIPTYIEYILAPLFNKDNIIYGRLRKFFS